MRIKYALAFGLALTAGFSSGSINASTVKATSTTASNYELLENGSPWPAKFRPYCENVVKTPRAPCPLNSRLPESPVTAPHSAAIISAMQTHGDLEFGFWRGEDAGGMPVYHANAHDPIVTVTCTRYCQGASVAINIPAKARPEAAICPGDCQMSVIEPNGVEYALYGQNPPYNGGATLSVMGLGWASIAGSGVDPKGVSLTYPGNGGGDVGNGIMFATFSEPTVAEINAGIIPHALNINTVCGSGQVYPGSTNKSCADYGYTGPAAGARFQLVLTDAQIDGAAPNTIGYHAAETAPWERVILRAMHDYGAYATITCGRACGDRINIYMENGTQYAAFGRTWPVSTFNWSSSGNNGGIGIVPRNWVPGGLSWVKALRIVDPCYALETC
jgi:hypothetical protein